jgi:hypothetical protein
MMTMASNFTRITSAFAPLLLFGCGATDPTITLKLIPYTADVSATLCIKQIRFKVAADSTGIQSRTATFTSKTVSLNAAGSTIGTLVVPAGGYTRIEVDAQNNCTTPSSPAITGSNGNGALSTNLTTTFVFSSSSLFRTSDAQILYLDPGPTATALEALSGPSASDVKDAVEGAPGSVSITAPSL